MFRGRTPRTRSARSKNVLVRTGTTTLETAIVLPAFLIFVFGIIEFGHAQMVSNVLKSATRIGARLGTTEGVSTAEVEARVNEILATAVDPNLVQVIVKDASEFDGGSSFDAGNVNYGNMPDIEVSDAAPRQLFLVRATLDYSQVSLIPNSWLPDLTIEGQTVMRHE